MKKAKKHTLKNIAITLAFPVLMWLAMEVVCMVVTKRHLISTALDIQNYVRSAGILCFTALALSYNLGNGRFDMSLGAQRMAAAILGGNLAIRLGLGSWGVLLFAFLFGLLFGALIGVLFVVTRIPAMVLGIGVALVYESVAFVGSSAKGLQLFGVPNVGSLSNMYVCMAVVLPVVILIFILDRYTRFGFYSRAIGSSQKIAHNCGINIFAHAVGCYTIAGGLVSFSGVFDTALKGLMSPELGLTSTTTVMTGCFPMFLGKFISQWSNEVLGIVVAAMTVRLYQTGLTVMRLSVNAQQACTGAAFLVFLIIRANQYYFKKRRKTKARIELAKEKKLAMQAA